MKIVCSNVAGKRNRRNVVLSTQKNKRMRENVVNVFGAKFLQTLMPVEIKLHSNDDEKNTDEGDDENHANGAERTVGTVTAQPCSTSSGACAQHDTKVLGFISKAGDGVGRSDNDRQFLFINGRPADLPAVVRALNECWRQFEMKHKPAAVLDFHLPQGTFDVNVNPDKREIFLTREKELLRHLKVE